MLPGECVLYDGTVLALHLGHRKSVDFDFFGKDALNLPKLEAAILFFAGARIIHREEYTLTALADIKDRLAAAGMTVRNGR